jgi:flagellar motor switch protein FliN/FliY
VAETIEYEQFDGQASSPKADPAHANGSEPASPAASSPQGDLSRLSEIPMELSVEIGRTHMTVGETLDLRVGSVVALERLAGETADLLVNGSAIARGEVVVIEEQYGLRITEILDGQSDSASSPAGEGEQAQPTAGAASPDPPQDDAEASSPDGETATPAEEG